MAKTKRGAAKPRAVGRVSRSYEPEGRTLIHQLQEMIQADEDLKRDNLRLQNENARLERVVEQLTSAAARARAALEAPAKGGRAVAAPSPTIAPRATAGRKRKRAAGKRRVSTKTTDPELLQKRRNAAAKAREALRAKRESARVEALAS